VRRVINAEIRRYILESLQRQTFVNRELFQRVARLSLENARLREEIEQLRAESREG
jgi:hypothetical protein